ncbi:hypothetical protein [Spirosoma montaniterrae]|uniref:Uncharacterized protein n=1 Tax=Spirosoma montaniterrae TaxID=1178516 RepID=A0A1P9WT18_9BACT|nr:hypothetical protein [Spirosoma montaniterrae]AQG78531.1 hypothetical protein AWR27_03755 [Spirosoma montaniterrae]
MKPFPDSISLSLQETLAVLLPGAVLTFFLLLFDTAALSTHTSAFLQQAWAKGVAFFGSAYFFGYVTYVVSSPFDGIYDRIKRYVLGIDTGKPVRNWVTTWLFPHVADTHALIIEVVEYKNEDIGAKYDGFRHQIIDAYQYAFRRLMKEEPAMFIEVEHYYATAKFFRSMVIVWTFGSAVWAVRVNGPDKDYAVLFLLLGLLSFFVFLNRWRKANHVAFKNVIIIEGLKTRNSQ